MKPTLSPRKLPKISHREELPTDQSFPVDHLSHSSMCLFSTNQLMFRIKYINRDVIDSSYSASFLLGKAFHYAIDIFFKCENDAVVAGLQEGMKMIEEYPEGFVKWTTGIPDRQTILEKFAFVYNARIPELKKDEKVVASELLIEKFVDVEWRGKRVVLPVKLKGILDRVYRDEQGRLIIEDDKACGKFSDPEKIDGRKIIQAVQYYSLLFAELGEEPYMMRFVETKHTKNKDGSKQTRAYDVIYAENELFFDFYLRYYGDVVRALMGQQVYVPNIDTMFDNEIGIIAYIHRLDEPEEKAKQQKLLKVDNITDVLKKKVTSVRNMKSLEKAIERSLVEYKNIDYSKMENQEKIATKLMEHGIVLHYDSKVEGNAFVQYRFTPSIGVKMSSLTGYAADIEQALGMSGVRVVAPIPDTTFVGVEIPKKDRTFVELTKHAIGGKASGLPIGVAQSGEVIRLHLDEMPHMLVAGASGSGKSVFLNTTIKAIVDQGGVDLKLIDPKQIELSQFAEHASEIAYDPQQAYEMLRNLVAVMTNRYSLLKSKGMKNYKDGGMKQIVCVVDEFAELMMGASKPDDGALSIEAMFVRIAQMGRAAGIHLIIATQRPEAKVITGLIKANFPTKVSFVTTSEINSRIILDQAGAEKLLGKGDGLVAHPKFSGLKRFQGYSL